MRDERVVVHRRFPSYDFVMRLDVPPKEAAGRLEGLLSHQERPKGFVFTDPRIDGAVHGSTFSFRRREAGFGGSVAPHVEGYFVPADGGSNAVLRVQVPRWWWFFDAVMIIGVALAFGRSDPIEVLLVVPFFTVVLLALTCGPVWAEAAAATKLLQKLYAKTAV